MSIIAAHQQGLIEQLEDEVAALAGRPRDHGQRAIVLHHLYDHSSGSHGWAIAEARRELRIAAALATLRRRVGRWGWVVARRERARAALAGLADALGEASRTRCAAAYRAYRSSAIPALSQEAERIVPPELLAALGQCHAARRWDEAPTPDALRSLFDGSEAVASAAVDCERLARAWVEIESTGLGRLARRLVSDRALSRATARDGRRGWRRIERDVRDDASIPASFRANPAQHFYRLQNLLSERRQRGWREACDREPDAFGLAA